MPICKIESNFFLITSEMGDNNLETFIFTGLLSILGIVEMESEITNTFTISFVTLKHASGLKNVFIVYCCPIDDHAKKGARSGLIF